MKDYIVPGQVFADETVLCIRCGTQIMGLSYLEMPNVTDPKKKVNVAHKKKWGSYRQLGVVMERNGRQRIAFLPCCQDCLKEIAPERDSDAIVKQIRRAVQVEARWTQTPDDIVEGIARNYADAKILRKLNPQELIEGKILQEA
jgi:hypothetical protein